jgi:hypothetical protein
MGAIISRRWKPMSLGKCRGCGEETVLHYGNCMNCRLVSPHRRPLNVKYVPPERRGRRGPIEHGLREPSRAQRVEGRKYLVCGCDYMEFSLDAKLHTPDDCPNRKVVIVARGHENG